MVEADGNLPNITQPEFLMLHFFVIWHKVLIERGYRGLVSLSMEYIEGSKS